MESLQTFAVRFLSRVVLGELRAQKFTLPPFSSSPGNRPSPHSTFTALPATTSSPNPTPATRPVPQYSEISQISAQGKACIPCGQDHYSTATGALGEAMRFAREGGLAHPEVISRITRAEDELNAFERIDGAPEKVVQLPPQEKQLMDRMLTESRHLRHLLSDMKDAGDLEQVAAKAQSLRKEFRLALFQMQMSKLSPEQKTAVKQRIAEAVEKKLEA